MAPRHHLQPAVVGCKAIDVKKTPAQKPSAGSSVRRTRGCANYSPDCPLRDSTPRSDRSGILWPQHAAHQVQQLRMPDQAFQIGRRIQRQSARGIYSSSSRGSDWMCASAAVNWDASLVGQDTRQREVPHRGRVSARSSAPNTKGTKQRFHTSNLQSLYACTSSKSRGAPRMESTAAQKSRRLPLGQGHALRRLNVAFGPRTAAQDCNLKQQRAPLVRGLPRCPCRV